MILCGRVGRYFRAYGCNHARMQVCPFEGCGRRFRDVNAVRRHVHVHKARDHVCEHCGKVTQLYVCLNACMY